MSDFDTHLVIHHIGGRGSGMGGYVADHIPAAFESDIKLVTYDADAECIDGISESIGDKWADVTVLPRFVGRESGRTTFYIRYDPHTCSAGVPDPRFLTYYSSSSGMDYMISETFEHLETIEIETEAFDTVLESMSHPAVDLLSIDVCAMSHDIFLGAERALNDKILAIVDNTAFPRFYGDQKVFPDILKLLEDRGFDFADFNSGGNFYPFRAPIGPRGRRFTIMGDALYFKRIKSIEAMPLSADEKYIKLRKLTFFAICFGYMETCLHALEVSSDAGASEEIKVAVRKRSYGRFLQEIEEAERKMPKRYHPKFVDKYSSQESHNRFIPSDKVVYAGVKGRLKSWVRSRPALLAAVRFARKDRGVKKRFKEVYRLMRIKFVLGATPVERVLRRYGFAEVAHLMRVQRFNDLIP